MLVAQKAVQAICNIALRLTGRADLCVDKLLSLLAMEMDYVTAESLVAMTSESGVIWIGCLTSLLCCRYPPSV